MPRFFINKDQIREDKIFFDGDDAHHISRSLRMTVDDEIVACDEEGIEYKCRLSGFSDSEVVADILSSAPSLNEPPFIVTLFQALPKGDKLDTIIQKAVECGVFRIVPFESERCIVRAKAEAEDKKQARRQRISEEAAKQCGRSIIPEVTKTESFENMLTLSLESDICLFCYEGKNTEPLGKLLKRVSQMHKNGEKRPSVSIIIGSEGGFSPLEAQKALQKGCVLTGLGKRILRTETASGFVLASISCFTELM